MSVVAHVVGISRVRLNKQIDALAVNYGISNTTVLEIP